MMIVIRVICAVVFSSMAAYAFAKVNFPLKNLFFYDRIIPADVSGTGVYPAAV